ncbi:hypothetical protein BsWGS_05406 [Bradybaena similaris]
MSKTQKAGEDELLKLFKKYDKDNSGTLSRSELEALLKEGNRNVTASQIDEVFKFFDEGGDQKITYEEFKEGLIKIARFIQEFKEFFNKYDADKSGFLDKNELKKILCESGHNFSDADREEILKRADTNKDNKISFEEFISAFT